MTENKAIRIHIHDNAHRIEALKEFMENNKGADERECKRNIFALEEANKALSEIQQYRSIGTVEECRAAVEKQRAKKPLQGEPYTWISSVRINGRYRDVRKTSYHHVCPNCRENVAMDMRCCKYCGQAIDWSDTP